MSLHDFLGSEGVTLSYNKTRVYNTKTLIEADLWPERELTNLWPATSKFLRRMLEKFPVNEFIAFREIREFAMSEYGYFPKQVANQMTILWRARKVRRFWHNLGTERGRRRARGVHYIFLPKKLWRKPELWPDLQLKKRHKSKPNLTPEQVREVRELYEQIGSQAEVARITGYSTVSIRNIVKGKAYKNVL